jgi:colicin import membrane protein
MEAAKRDHDKRASIIEAQRAALEKQSQAEDAGWQKQKEKLEHAMRRDGGR